MHQYLTNGFNGLYFCSVFTAEIIHGKEKEVFPFVTIMWERVAKIKTKWRTDTTLLMRVRYVILSVELYIPTGRRIAEQIRKLNRLFRFARVIFSDWFSFTRVEASFDLDFVAPKFISIQSQTWAQLSGCVSWPQWQLVAISSLIFAHTLTEDVYTA